MKYNDQKYIDGIKQVAEQLAIAAKNERQKLPLHLNYYAFNQAKIDIHYQVQHIMENKS